MVLCPKAKLRRPSICWATREGLNCIDRCYVHKCDESKLSSNNCGSKPCLSTNHSAFRVKSSSRSSSLLPLSCHFAETPGVLKIPVRLEEKSKVKPPEAAERNMRGSKVEYCTYFGIKPPGSTPNKNIFLHGQQGLDLLLSYRSSLQRVPCQLCGT